MKTGQEFIAAASAFTTVAGLVLVAVYGVVAPWWRSHVGLMMMVYAVTITALSTIALLATGFGVDPGVLRVVRAALILAVGLVMVSQTVIILRRQLTNRGA